MNYSFRYQFATALGLALAAGLVSASLALFTDRSFTVIIAGGTAIAAGVLAILIPMVTMRAASVGTSHIVAILGFPRSGKTTLLVSLFGEIFAKKMLAIRAIPRGPSTIDIINESLALLARGETLKPTTDQDHTAFRADVTVERSLFFPRTYKVEFGDFPGDDTADYVMNYGPWLHTTPFFRWVLDADALVFVVDLAEYLTSLPDRRALAAQRSSAIRAAWQHIVDTYGDMKKDIRRIPVVLAFTKADLFGVLDFSVPLDAVRARTIHLGFDTIPPIKEIDVDLLEFGKEGVLADFTELIAYLKGEVRQFSTIFVSSFGTIEGRRLGIEELLWAVLPRP